MNRKQNIVEHKVILIDKEDNELGAMDKTEVHQKGLLHRAFSVFIFNNTGKMLLQQRAAGKYHGGLLWTNACCSHPLPGEKVLAAANRRLQEEMGFTTPLTFAFSFTYKASVGNGLTEHEFDHVFTGMYEGAVHPDPAEVEAYEWLHMDEIERQLTNDPDQFTSWFGIAFPRVKYWWERNYLIKDR